MVARGEVDGGGDHAAGAERGRVAAGGGALPGCRGGAADAGAGAGAGGLLARGGGTEPAWIGRRLRDWVHRYNAEGLAGLRDRPRPGPQPRLTPEQMTEVGGDRGGGSGPGAGWRGPLAAGRPPGADQARFDVELHERSVGKVLRRLGFAACRCARRHPRASPTAQEAFKKTSPAGDGGAAERAPPASRSRSGSRTRPASASRAR